MVPLRRALSAHPPHYATDQAAGMDLCAYLHEPVVIAPGMRALIPTGIALQLPEGYEAQVRSRSGLALKYGVVVLNAPGTIDSDYRGDIGVILINLGQESFTVEPSMRIAQLVVAPYTRVLWQETEDLATTVRQEGGFGSTGSF